MHDPQRTLESLKALRRERGDTSSFSTHTEFLRWTDDAAALMAFNPELAASFKNSTRAATTVREWEPEKYIPAINNAIGTVNKGITLLEHQLLAEAAPGVQLAPPTNMTAPEKLTLKWLYEHAPWSFYVWFFGVAAASFALGFSTSKALTRINNENLRIAAPTTMKPTIASPPVKAASTP